MAQQTVNIGSSPNAGDGDPTRVAFTKVNINFDEVYSRIDTLEEGPGTGTTVINSIIGNVYAEDSTLLVDAQNASISWSNIVNAPDFLTEVTDINGSVFGDDSTLLVDAVNSSIPWNVISDVPNFQLADAPYTGDVQGSIFGNDSTLLVDGVNNTIPWNVISDVQVTESQLFVDFASIIAVQLQNNGFPVQMATQTLDISGSVFADDSTMLVDSVNGLIVGNVQTERVDGNDSEDGVILRIQAGMGIVTEGGELLLSGGSGTTRGGNLTIQGGSGLGDAGGDVYINGGDGITTDGVIYIGVNNTNWLQFNTPTVYINNNGEPNPQAGMIAYSDGTAWNPAGDGLQHLNAYLNGVWVQIA